MAAFNNWDSKVNMGATKIDSFPPPPPQPFQFNPLGDLTLDTRVGRWWVNKASDQISEIKATPAFDCITQQNLEYMNYDYQNSLQGFKPFEPFVTEDQVKEIIYEALGINRPKRPDDFVRYHLKHR